LSNKTPPLIFLVIFLIVLANMNIYSINSAPDQEIRYRWRGIVIQNGSSFIVGGYEIRAKTTKDGFWGIYVYKGGVYVGGVIRPIGATWQYKSDDIVEGGKKVFTVGLYINRSTQDYLSIDLIDCIFPPPGNLVIEIDPQGTIEFEEGLQKITIDVTVINNSTVGSQPSYLVTNIAKIEGNGTYELLYVEGIPSHPENVTVPSLAPFSNITYKYHFSFDPGGKRYCEFLVSFTLNYIMEFRYNKTLSTSTMKVYDYYPEGHHVTENANLTVKIGEKFKLAGKPNLKITLAKNATLVYPKGSVKFRFSVRNEGNGSAYNVKIWIEVNPPTEIQFLDPAEIGRILTGSLTKPLQLYFPNGTPGAPLPPDTSAPSEGDIVFLVKAPDYPITGNTEYKVQIIVEWDDLAGRHFNTTTQEGFTVIEPGRTQIVVTKEVQPLVVSVNGTLSVSVTVKNEGEEPARNLKITDVFPEQYFKLVSGETSLTRGILRPDEAVTLSYVLKAKIEGRAPIDRATVEYTDETGSPRHVQSNPGGVVSIVKPEIEYEIKERPEPYEIVGSYVFYRISVRNKGTGIARNIEIVVQLPDTLMIINVGEGCDIEETSNRVKFSVSELPPNEEKELFLELRPLTTGKYNITVVKTTYYSPDGGTKYTFPIPVVEFRAMKPFAIRVMLTVILVATVVIVGVLVIAVTIGIRIGKKRPTMRRLGRKGFR